MDRKRTKADQMLEMVKATQGTMGILATIIAFTLSVIGVYIGYSILKGHLQENQMEIEEKIKEDVKRSIETKKKDAINPHG